VALSVALPFTERLRVVEQLVLSDQDGDATNTVAHPNRVVPRHSAQHSLESGELRATLPPASWTIVRLEAY